MFYLAQKTTDSFVLNRGGAHKRTAPYEALHAVPVQSTHFLNDVKISSFARNCKPPRSSERSEESFAGGRKATPRRKGAHSKAAQASPFAGSATRQAGAARRASDAPATTQQKRTVRIIHGQDTYLPPKKRKIYTVLLSIALVIALATGSTLAYFTAQDEKVRTVPLATIELTLAEENWDSSTGTNYQAGLTAHKDPTITATTGNMYTRMSMKIQETVDDGEGGTTTQLITDTARLALIEGILYADPNNALTTGTAYSSTQIAAAIASQGVTPLYNSALFAAPTKPTAGQYYFDYLSELTQGQTATLFTKVVIPSDYTQENLDLMGDFIITIEGQGIQSYGFSNRQDALDELDKAVS